MRKALIKPVEDGKEKFNTYKINIDRYNKAIADRYYLEAIVIDYAMIEDRLLSILYHSGAFVSRKTLKVNSKKTKPVLKEIVSVYGQKNNLGLSTISGKINIVRSISNWCMSEKEMERNAYKTVLYNVWTKDNCAELSLNCMHDIEQWCAYRNEIIHSLMNKNIDILNKDLLRIAREGMNLSRQLDKIDSKIKKNDVIRKTINMPTNWNA